MKNNLKILKTICVLLLLAQRTSCDFDSSFEAAKRVNTSKGFFPTATDIDGYDRKIFFLIGFIERNQEGYFSNNPYGAVSAEPSGYLVGDPRCPHTGNGDTKYCGICNRYAPSGDRADVVKYKLCQWGYNINWPFYYNGNGGWGPDFASCEPMDGGNLMTDISYFQGNTNINTVRSMWGKGVNSFNLNYYKNPTTGCSNIGFCDGCHPPIGWYCNDPVETNQMNLMKGNSGGADITGLEIQANFP